MKNRLMLIAASLALWIAFTILMFLSVFATPVLGMQLDQACKQYDWACAQSNMGPVPPIKTVKLVNRLVNETVEPIYDIEQHGVNDDWSLPTPLGGDCEDYALLKKKLLMGEGVSPARLRLTVVLRTTQDGVEGHAVLLYDDGQQFWVLDNLTNRVLHPSKTKYRFMYIQGKDDPTEWERVNF